jgi:hypothetical protein
MSDVENADLPVLLLLPVLLTSLGTIQGGLANGSTEAGGWRNYGATDDTLER